MKREGGREGRCQTSKARTNKNTTQTCAEMLMIGFLAV